MKISVGAALLGLATVLVLSSGTEGYLGCYNLHAAFTFRDTQFFIYGKYWMVGVDFSGNIVHWGHIMDTGYQYPVTAAVGVRRDDMFYLMTGKYETAFNSFNNQSDYLPLYWSGAEDELLVNPDYQGIDAAFEGPNSTVVYFAGCEYVAVDVMHMSYEGVHGNITDLGLPCHVDAAWSSPNHQIAYITKGLNLWRWFAGQEKVEGPYHLFSFFCPLSTFLCPA